MARLVNVDVSGELVKLYSCYENDGIFVHRNLLEERSSYFKTRIDNGKFGEHGHVAVRFDEVTHEAREMLVGWLYGQPLHAKYTPTSSNLHYLAELYDIACDVERESGTRDDEFTNATLDAIIQCLAQKSETLYGPIDTLESVLQEDDKFPGKAVVLKELVSGECARDGRTKFWLDEYCGREWHKTEVVQIICLEFAKNACEYGQNNSSTNSTSTTN